VHYFLSKEVETKLNKRGLDGWGLKRRLGQDLQREEIPYATHD